MAKLTKKEDSDLGTACEAPVCWSKHTTNITSLLTVIVMYVSSKIKSTNFCLLFFGGYLFYAIQILPLYFNHSTFAAQSKPFSAPLNQILPKSKFDY